MDEAPIVFLFISGRKETDHQGLRFWSQKSPYNSNKNFLNSFEIIHPFLFVFNRKRNFCFYFLYSDLLKKVFKTIRGQNWKKLMALNRTQVFLENKVRGALKLENFFVN
mgnify:CR=1 FL=1